MCSPCSGTFYAILVAPSAPPPCVDTAQYSMNMALSGGSSVTLTGFNFALPARGGDYTATAVFAVVQPCRTTSWSSATSAVCRVADLSSDQVRAIFRSASPGANVAWG